MKQKRAKAYRKQMQYYHINFKFREPYQVLVDEEIVIEACKTKFDLVQGLERTVQGNVKPMITQCGMEALYRSKNEDAITMAKRFERRKCGHRPVKPGEEEDEKSTKSAFDCMVSVVNINGKNKHRYIVATQKMRLRQLFRKIPAIPLVYINRSVMILEPMSPVTENARKEIERAKLNGGLNDTVQGTVQEEDEEGKKKKRKGPKGPNPLSVKKKKGETNENSQPSPSSEEQPKKKRTRRHKRSEPKSNAEDNKPEAAAELSGSDE